MAKIKKYTTIFCQFLLILFLPLLANYPSFLANNYHKNSFFSNFILAQINLLQNKANAFAPEEKLANQQDEKRAKKLFLKVKCLSCQGQVIESSNSNFAISMRQFIRQQISQGFSDEQIINQLITQFGEEVISAKQFNNYSLFFWLILLFFSFFLALFFLLKLAK